MVKMTVNDKTVTVDAEPDTPLLWVLRDELDLFGTKFGCGKGLCGVCTVHIDGNAVRSCQVRIGTLSVASRIKTVEGLEKNGNHPVQTAWMEINVPQCGYCQSGQIMSAAALLERNPSPSDEDIDQAMSGNLCRCATYPRIRAAIHRAARIGASRKKGD